MSSQEDLTYKGLIFFSIPSILSSLLEPLSATIDTAMVGQVSTVWLGGLALSVTLLSSFTWMFNFLVHASTQSVAASSGGSSDSIAESVKTSLMVALLVGIFSSLFLWLFKPILFNLVGVTPAVYEYTDEYYSVRIIGHTFTLLYTTLVSLLRGLGRINISFFMVALTTSLNALFTYLALFVFDWGLAGAAWGTTGSFTLGTFVSFIIVLKDKKLEGKFLTSRIKKEKWFQFGRNSLNIFGRSFTLTSTFFIATRIASGLGVNELASHQILLQIWLFGSFLLDGVAVSGTVLGAKYFALGNLQSVKTVFFRLLIIGGGIGLIFTITYFLAGRWVMGLFTTDENILILISSLWFLIVLSQVPNAIAFVYDGLLFGLEKFAYLRAHMIIGCLLIFIPFAWTAYLKESLFFLWTGMILLNFYRWLTGFLKVRQVVHV